MSKEFINQIKEKYNPTNCYTLDGFDDCIIGYDFTNSKMIYSETLILQQLCTTLAFDEALEYYYFNIVHSVDKVTICSTFGE